MAYVKWGFWGVFWLLVFAVFHYSLPQNDVVRIVNTYEERQELNDWTRMFWSSPDAQSAELTNRDVQFIQGVRPNGEAMVYRNEDTGWGWPPYFKLDSSNLQTEAEDMASTSGAPVWIALTHYGWRSEFLTIFPNAVAVRTVEGPDTRIIPWVNIIILTILALIVWAITVRVMRFRRNRIDPLLEAADEQWDESVEALQERRRGIRAWLDTWRGKPRK